MGVCDGLSPSRCHWWNGVAHAGEQWGFIHMEITPGAVDTKYELERKLKGVPEGCMLSISESRASLLTTHISYFTSCQSGPKF